LEHKKQRGTANENHDKLRDEFEAKIEKELSTEQFEKFKQIMSEKHKRKGNSQRRPKK